MRIESSDHRVGLELREPEDGDRDQFEVVIDGRELHVVASVARCHQDDRLRLADWFSMLAARWAGWDEEFEWDSDEGEVGLIARHDGVGHVFLTVRLSPHWGAWRADATLDVAPGNLDEIERELRKFAEEGAN